MAEIVNGFDLIIVSIAGLNSIVGISDRALAIDSFNRAESALTLCFSIDLILIRIRISRCLPIQSYPAGAKVCRKV